LKKIIQELPEAIKKEDGPAAINQIISAFSFHEKNNQALHKYLQFYRSLIELDPAFKIDNLVKVLAFVLDKSADSRFEKSAE